MKRKSRAAGWTPAPGDYANYIGPKAGRRGHLLEIVAEASGQRMVVRGIGRAGRPVQFTVLAKNLSRPQPQLF
jgi:hypothetical protein